MSASQSAVRKQFVYAGFPVSKRIVDRQKKYSLGMNYLKSAVYSLIDLSYLFSYCSIIYTLSKFRVASQKRVKTQMLKSFRAVHSIMKIFWHDKFNWKRGILSYEKIKLCSGNQTHIHQFTPGDVHVLGSKHFVNWFLNRYKFWEKCHLFLFWVFTIYLLWEQIMYSKI